MSNEDQLNNSNQEQSQEQSSVKSKNIFIWVIFLVVALLAGYFIYYVSSNDQGIFAVGGIGNDTEEMEELDGVPDERDGLEEQEPSEQSSDNSTEDWPVYRNGEYGFSFALPEDFEEREDAGGPSQDWDIQSFENDDYIFSVLVESMDRLNLFSEEQITGSLEQTAEIIDSRNTYTSVIRQTETEVDGVPALEMEGFSLDDTGGFVHLQTVFLSEDSFLVITLESKQNYGSQVSNQSFVEENLDQSLRDLNSQILSTFKFLD